MQTKQLHVDTTSFFVRGEDASKGGQEGAGTPGVRETATDPARIAITYGSSREHRADLTQGMLAFATTPEGDIPLFFQPWDGNSSDPGAMMRQTSLWQTMGSPAKRR